MILRRAGKLIAGLLAVLIGLLVLLWVLAWVRERDDAVPAGIRLVPTALGRVATAESGPAAGPPVLLIHGTAGWSGFWREVATHLAARGWRVIAADVPPFGWSDRDAAGRYGRVDQAQRLSEVLRATADGRPATVVAHSFGAGAGVELALRDPAAVGRLVLVDPALGVPDAAPAGGGLFAARVLAEPLTAATITNPWALLPLLRTMLARKDSADRWYDTLRAPMRRPGTTAAYARWLPALFASDDGAVSRTSAGLKSLRPPVALIWGEADTVTPIAQGEALAELVHPRAFLRLPGLGHIPHIEDPAAFTAALDQALTRLGSGNGAAAAGGASAR